MQGSKILLALCAAGFFWIFALHAATGFLNFMIVDGVGSRSGMVALIDDIIQSALVEPLGRPLASALLVLLGVGAGWLVYKSSGVGGDQ